MLIKNPNWFLEKIKSLGNDYKDTIILLSEMVKQDSIECIKIFSYLEYLDIRGIEIFLIFNDYCNKNNSKFKSTIFQMLIGSQTKDKIIEETKKKYIKPFQKTHLRVIKSD